MTPKKTIEDLWENGFFESSRTVKQIEKEIWEKHKVTCSNLPMTLKLKSIKKILRKKNSRWIQTRPFKGEKGIQIYYFGPEKPRQSRQSFVSILSKLKGEIKICDPYLNEDTLDALEKIKGANIRFLTRNSKNNIKVSNKDLQDFKKENLHVEIKGFAFDHLHDRYIISKDMIYLLGHGFSIRNKESFVIGMSEKIAKDLIQSLSATFDTRWKNQNTLKLC